MYFPEMTDEEKREAHNELVCLVWLRHREHNCDILRDLIWKLDSDLSIAEEIAQWKAGQAKED